MIHLANEHLCVILPKNIFNEIPIQHVVLTAIYSGCIIDHM